MDKIVFESEFKTKFHLFFPITKKNYRNPYVDGDYFDVNKIFTYLQRTN